MEEIDFHFDPLCPWAWLTSRWALRMQQLGEVRINWRLFSLVVIHLPSGEDPAVAGGRHGHGLETLALARREAGNQAVERLYTEIGRAVHGRGAKPGDPGVIEAALGAAGLDPGWHGLAAADPSLWDDVLRDHRAAVEACEAFGVPTLILDGGRGPGAFGPVITTVPDDQEGRELLRDTVRMLRREYLFEFKRDREGHPAELVAPGLT